MDSILDMLSPAISRTPEIKGISTWVNSKPLTLADLKGKVVLIDFWTFSCINCIRTQPYLNAWYDKYKAAGFEIIGVHTPEFEFEKQAANVERAVKDEKILYPVALDNDYATWNSFDNHYWPAKYLIDQHGKVQYMHFGEGDYDEIERRIQILLGASGGMVTISGEQMHAQAGQTPETYLGYARGRNFVNQNEFQADKATDYKLLDVDDGSWSLGGQWRIGPEDSVATSDGAVLRMGFSAKEVYLVMEGQAGTSATLKVNGKAVTPTINGGADVAAGGRVHFDGARLYKVVKMPVFTENATLDVMVPKDTTVNAFTFGG